MVKFFFMAIFFLNTYLKLVFKNWKCNTRRQKLFSYMNSAAINNLIVINLFHILVSKNTSKFVFHYVDFYGLLLILT